MKRPATAGSAAAEPEHRAERAAGGGGWGAPHTAEMLPLLLLLRPQFGKSSKKCAGLQKNSNRWTLHYIIFAFCKSG